MFKKLNLENFRSFSKVNLTFAPITLFVGPNNSGKSSALSALRLLAQTLESNDPNVRLLLNGPFGDFGTYKDLVHGNQTRKQIKMSFDLDVDEKERSLISTSTRVHVDLKYKYRSALKEVVLKEISLIGDNEHLLTCEFIEDSERFIPRKISKTQIPASYATTTSRMLDFRNFIPRMLGSSIRTKELLSESLLIGEDEESALRQSSRIGFTISRHFQNIEYVGAMRMPPARTFLYAGERRRRVGSNGEYAAAILAMDSMRRGGKARGIRTNVVNWLTSAGIASDVRIVSLSDRYYEIQVQHPITKEYENYADVGYGNSQVVPVLIAGYNLARGETFIVEEPEIHLHPKAQAELGDFFVELHERGVQSIIETHSEHMIIRLQQHVASGRIKPSDICIYYTEPTVEGKTVRRLEIDNRGVFKNEWPGGFFSERLEEATKLARLRSSSLRPIDKEVISKRDN